MATNGRIESRLEAVEEAVAELKSKVNAPQSPTPDWLDRIIGSFADFPEFEEVLRLGREFRMADRRSARSSDIR